ncbi:MAG: STAS domain-containing protein [Deltaproteobacteria bacterium]|nr:STAS domain-containing protein [Deltaproteobacteria bacterium]
MEISKHEDRITVTLEGDLTSETLNDFRDSIQAEINAGGRDFVIDFRNTVVIDSMGIGCLVATYNTLKQEGGSISLRNLPDNLKEVFQIMRLDRLLAIE